MNKINNNDLIRRISRLEITTKKRSIPRPKAKGLNKKKRVQLISGPQPLSKCAEDYLRALENPFSGRPVCLPVEFSFPSCKVSYRIRGTFSTSTTTGMGGISFSPISFFFNDTNTVVAGNPNACCVFTTAASLLSAMPFPSDVGASSIGSNSTFATTAGAADVSYRVVAAGIRVRNSTQLLNRGGVIYGLETPTHYALDGMGTQSFNASDASALGDVNGEWNSVVWHPHAPVPDYQDLNFSNIGTNAAPSTTSNRSLGFFVQAPTGTPQTYEFELVGVYETTGRIVHGLTPSYSDPQGLARVQNSHASIESRRPVVGDRSAFAQNQIYKAVMNAGATLVAGAINYTARRLTYHQGDVNPNRIMASRSIGPIIQEID